MATTSADVSITREQLTKYFHLPITDVAKELGICATMLKKICRKNGIPRWPHRKIKSLNKMIESLEASLPNDGSEAGECIRQEILILKNKKSLIMRNPSILVQSNKRATADSDDTPNKKQRVESIEAPITTFTGPKGFPHGPSTPNSFSINQLLTSSTSFATPLTANGVDEKDPYRSYHPLHHPMMAPGAPYPPDYADAKHASSSFAGPLTSYLPNEEDEHNRHGDMHAPPSPPHYAAGHPADPYYYHKAAMAYQYQYHRQFPQHQQHPYYPPQTQGSPRANYLSPYMQQPQVQPTVQQQPQSQPQQPQEAIAQSQQTQPAQPQTQPTQQGQQLKSTPPQTKPAPVPGAQKEGSMLPKINLSPGQSQEGYPLKFRPPSPLSSGYSSSELAYYYPHLQQGGYPQPPQRQQQHQP